MFDKFYSRYVGFRLSSNGLDARENLDSIDEVNDWLTLRDYPDMVVLSNSGNFVHVANGTHSKKYPLEQLEVFVSGFTANKK